MALKILVLLVASTLLGAAPGCLCESAVETKAPENACGHCPEESAPKPVGHSLPDCCCAGAPVDRDVEDSFVTPTQNVTFDLEYSPAELTAPHFDTSVERPASVAAVLRQAGPPLHLLFRRLTI